MSVKKNSSLQKKEMIKTGKLQTHDNKVNADCWIIHKV